MQSQRWLVVSVMVVCGVGVTGRLAAVEVQPPLENAISKALETKISAEFANTPLVEAIAELCKLAKVPHHIDLPALQDEGVDRSSPVTQKWKDARLAVILQDVFRPMGLCFSTTAEWLTVTTIAKTEEKLTARVYDVRKLVELMKPRLVAAASHGQVTFGGGQAQFGDVMCGGVGGLSTNPLALTPLATVRFPIDGRSKPFAAETHLMVAIQEAMTDPWEQIDGVGGTMVPGNGRLTILQSDPCHHRIYNLLAGLETMLSDPNPPPQMLVGISPEDRQRWAAMNQSLDMVTKYPAGTISIETWIETFLDERGGDYRVDSAALQDEGIDWSAITVTVTPGVSRRTLLNTALESNQLAMVFDAGRYFITTQAKAEEDLKPVLYNIAQIPEAFDLGWLTNLLLQSTTGQWESLDGVGGTVACMGMTEIVSVYQTERVHEQIALLLKALRRPEAPSQPEAGVLSTCLYPISDVETLADLQRILPKLVEMPDATWPEGSVEKLGLTLVVRQTEAVHRRIETIVRAMHTRHQPHDAAKP